MGKSTQNKIGDKFHFAVLDKKHTTVLKSLQLEILEFGTAAEIICQDQFGRKYIHSPSFGIKEI